MDTFGCLPSTFSVNLTQPLCVCGVLEACGECGSFTACVKRSQPPYKQRYSFPAMRKPQGFVLLLRLDARKVHKSTLCMCSNSEPPLQASCHSLATSHLQTGKASHAYNCLYTAVVSSASVALPAKGRHASSLPNHTRSAESSPASPSSPTAGLWRGACSHACPKSPTEERALWKDVVLLGALKPPQELVLTGPPFSICTEQSMCWAHG